MYPSKYRKVIDLLVCGSEKEKRKTLENLEFSRVLRWWRQLDLNQ